MNKYKTIEIEIIDNIATVWLNRPEIHNAFNEQMITELTDSISNLNLKTDVRLIMIRGRGRSFCAGADLKWMKGVVTYDYQRNFEESLNLANLFNVIYRSSKPTIAVVHGAAYGGANGILASCDFAFCDDNTVFSLSEVKIGIIPATISPYIIKRVGEFTSRDIMLTGRRFKGPEAESLNLVNKSLGTDKIDDYIKSVVDELKTSGPEAVSKCKELIFKISDTTNPEDILEYSAKIIAEIRASKEGQEGMEAFLNKRNPDWIK